MNKIKTLETKNCTYYCGYATKYEKTEEEKVETRYMIMQKTVGSIIIIVAILSLRLVKVAPEVGMLIILMILLGIGLILTKEHAICL